MSRRHREDNYVGSISSGAFLILLALFYITNPSLLNEAKAFIQDFSLTQVYQNFYWFVPSTNHPVLYTAAAQFSYIFGLIHLAILALLLAKRSSVRSKARTLSRTIFWVGTGYAFGVLAGGTLEWIPFLGALLVLVGISMVVRSTILLLAFRHRS